jgi:hypothetical protein
VSAEIVADLPSRFAVSSIGFGVAYTAHVGVGRVKDSILASPMADPSRRGKADVVLPTKISKTTPCKVAQALQTYARDPAIGRQIRVFGVDPIAGCG